MAKHSGILDKFSGKVGPVVGASWNGIQYLRSRPSLKKDRKLSVMQKYWQDRFALGTRFIQSMGNLPSISFQDEKGKMTKNSMQGRLLTQAISNRYPDLYIDYTQVDIARGDLKKAVGARAEADAPGLIRFSWTDNTGMGNAAATDLAILVAYNAETNDMVWTANTGTRSSQSALLDVHWFSGKEVHTWVFFRSVDGKKVADSCYTGMVRVE